MTQNLVRNTEKWEKKQNKTTNRHDDEGIAVRLETQRVRGHRAAVLHHRCRDGPHVLEELSGLAGAQRLDVSHDPVVGLRSQGRIKSSLNV